MTDEREADQRKGDAELFDRRGEPTVAERTSVNHSATNQQQQRDPLNTLTGCERILILGRTGSGKTTIARELAAALGVTHVELDSLYFGPDFSRAPLSGAARENSRGNRRGSLGHGRQQAHRPRPGLASGGHNYLARLPRVCELVAARKARAPAPRRSAREAAQTGRRTGLPKQMLAAARGVLTALISHRGQRREYPRMFAQPANQHLAVARLHSARRRLVNGWLASPTWPARLRRTLGLLGVSRRGVVRGKGESHAGRSFAANQDVAGSAAPSPADRNRDGAAAAEVDAADHPSPGTPAVCQCLAEPCSVRA